jgi:uncharacterized protein (TIGR02147 family)
MTTNKAASILKAEFEKKRSKNAKYSLRAFARDLGISCAAASRLMNSKLGLSKKRALEIAVRLGFEDEEALYFSDLVTSENARSKKDKAEATRRLSEYNTRFNSMEIERFRVISKWYCLPVMELVRLHGEKATPKFLSKKLNISFPEASLALKALTSIGVIRDRQVISDFIALPDGPPDQDIRRFHQDVLEKAKHAVATQPKKSRNIGCAIVRMRREDVDWASSELRKFRRRLAKRIEEGTGHDAIYALSTQLFRLDTDDS